MCASFTTSTVVAVTCLVVAMGCHMGVHVGWMVSYAFDFINNVYMPSFKPLSYMFIMYFLKGTYSSLYISILYKIFHSLFLFGSASDVVKGRTLRAVVMNKAYT